MNTTSTLVANISSHGNQLIGMVAAAKLLGVSRSALHLAVKQHQIIPDHRTLKGHVRFKLETLEAFRVRLRYEPATGEVRPRLLRTLTRELAHGKCARDLARLALAEIKKLYSTRFIGWAYRFRPKPNDPWEMEDLAVEGLPAEVPRQFKTLVPTHEFEFIKVLRAGEMFVCRDVNQEHVAPGTRAFIEYANLQSFADFPIVYGDTAIGILGMGFAEPHDFHPQEIHLYTHLADLLAIALHQQQEFEAYQNVVGAAGTMITAGLASAALPRDGTMEWIGSVLTDLAQCFRDATGAFTVICTAGPPAPGMVEDAQVRAFAEKCMQERRHLWGGWQAGGKRVSAIGVPVPLPMGPGAGIAAAWLAPKGASAEDMHLLQVMAGACVLALSRR